MSATMPESHRDLLDTPVAAFSTIGPMGYPQTTAVWFLNDNGRIVVVIHPDRQKTKNLQATPKCDFFIVDPANPMRTLEIRADVTFEADEDFAYADKLSTKYGMDVRTLYMPGRHHIACLLDPVRVNAINMGG